MPNEDDADGNVLSRGLSSIRGVFTGQSSDAEQARESSEQRREDAVQTQASDDGSGAVTGETGEPPRQQIETYADIMERCAAGDFTQRMEPTGEDEELDRLARGFNDLVSDLEKTTDQLKSYVDEVESTGVVAEQSSDTVRRASEDVVDSMQNISAQSESQRDRLETTAEQMDAVAASLEELAATHSDVDAEPQVTEIGDAAAEIRDATETNEAIQTETTIVSAASEEQAAELSEISSRASDLQRYTNPLRAILDRFTTGSEQGSDAPSGSATGD